MNTRDKLNLYYAMEEAYTNCKWGDVSRHNFHQMMKRLKRVYGKDQINSNFKHIQSIQGHNKRHKLERLY